MMRGKGTHEKMAGVKTVDMCLGFRKQSKNSEVSVHCLVCGLPGVSKSALASLNDFLKCLEESKKKNTGMTYWVCRPCTAYAQGVNHRMKEMERRLDVAEDMGKKNTEDIARVEKVMEKLEQELEKEPSRERDNV
jgi:hypothetical protein